jgi:hypothetical protein
MSYKVNKLFETWQTKYMIVFDGKYKELFYILSKFPEDGPWHRNLQKLSNIVAIHNMCTLILDFIRFYHFAMFSFLSQNARYWTHDNRV